ncbi:hypothetical protein NBRC110019_26010 [Neptunitalea chrysea]|uniref:DUF2911 domain-containing protein n=1 Tax=Neptunitalea chrysea TaxID=1647581 RepID=A0A9W6B6P5_9FLAO|nr:DUF2911 domain-containing protein [Neptunitalea chrysea]GLB53560.1 hypothetical protein NBRC110019_26010 [Neptunitalea chrysea]
MMIRFKTHLTLFLTFVLIVLASNFCHAQKFNGLDMSPHDISYFRIDNNAAPLIKVLYGRPQLRGRSIGKEIVPFGKIWRTGANEATEIRFYSDVIINDTLLKAGTYSLLTIPEKREWTFIINKDVDVWGAYSYDENKDVVRIKTPSENGKESLDALSIAFNKEEDDTVNLVVGWGKTRAFLPITFPTKPQEQLAKEETTPEKNIETEEKTEKME